MTWQPPPRPGWVRDVNAGAVLSIAEEAALPLTRGSLLGEARATLGLDGRGIAGFSDARLDAEAFVDALDVLLPALEDEADLTVLGRAITRRFLLRLLEVRAQTVAYLRADEGLLDEHVDRPVVITGAPRTGTTILHALLARAPGMRAPEGWELLRPVPPPDPDMFPDPDRVSLADRELRRPALVASGLDAIHEYGGRMLKECVSAMSFAFRSEEFTARYRVPSYVDWLGACDMRPAYDWHRTVLQILQRRSGPTRWVLKSPVHVHSIPTLLRTYPDAHIVVTHRDPLSVLASVTSLIATLRYAHSDVVDLADIGSYHAELYGHALDHLVDLADDGTLDPTRVHHIRYADFVADPMPTVAAALGALDVPTTTGTLGEMRARLDAGQDATGEHRYSFDDLGLDGSVQRKRFRRYQDRFDVPDEIAP
jgi:hypothetical protein